MDRRIVLLGKTGSGKSSTGNTILRGEYFEHRCSAASVTKKCEVQTINHISVVDTPGMCDTNLSEDELKHEIEECVKMSVPGPHVFLLVIRLGRFTDERNTVRWIQENFGEDAKLYTIVLFTHADQLGKKTIEQYLEQNPELRRVINTCGGRYCVFNNNDQQPNQVQNLMQKIDDVVKMNEGKHYTSEMYEEAQRELSGFYCRTALGFVARLAVIAAKGAAVACLATIAAVGLAGADLAGAGLATTAGVGAAVACLAITAAVGAAVACLATIAGTSLAGAGLAITAAVGAAVACLATIAGTGLAGADLVAAGLATTAAVGAAVARLATIAGVGLAGAGLATVVAVGAAVACFATIAAVGAVVARLAAVAAVGAAVACLATIAGAGLAGAGLAGAGSAAVGSLVAVMALQLVERYNNNQQ